MGIRPYSLDKIEIRNGWLFPDDRVSYSNKSIINVNKITHINYYQNTSSSGYQPPKGKKYYITFGNEVEKWWCKDEETAIEVYNDIFELLYAGSNIEVNLKDTDEK